MRNIFFISDTHFGHSNILTFKKDDGSHLREFDDVHHMNETMIHNWNTVVQTGDKVYHLGDVVFGKEFIPLLGFLKGQKVLIKGNHDRHSITEYQKYFKDIRGADMKGEWKMLLTHIPVHPDSIKGGWTNVHGHLHRRTLTDPRYFNVSVERIKYTPIELGQLRELIKDARIN